MLETRFDPELDCDPESLSAWSAGAGELPGTTGIWAGAALPSEDRETLWRCTRDELRWRRLPKLATGRRSDVARMELSVGPVVVKRYSHPGAYRLRTFARRSRAEREARAMAAVAAALPDDPVRVLAWAEERRFGFVSRTYLVATELRGSFDLRAVPDLDEPTRRAVIRAVTEELPRLVAQLHTGRVYAASLRGKNVLYQPAANRFALIDLPYAHRVRRVSLHQRIRDLAMLSIQLNRFLDTEQWKHFLDNYRLHESSLKESDAAHLGPEQIGRVAARLAHRTPVAAARKALKKRFRRSGLGRWVTGNRYSEQGA